MSEQTYVTGYIKPARRGKRDIAAIRTAIKEVLEHDSPQIIRQIYYALWSEA